MPRANKVPNRIAISAYNGDGMNKFTLLRATVLIILQGILEMREFKKRFWAEMAARVHRTSTHKGDVGEIL